MAPSIVRRSEDIVAVQETCITPSVSSSLRSQFRDEGWQLMLTPTAEGAHGPNAGVGLMVRGTRPAIMCKPKTGNFRLYFDAGRVGHFIVAAGNRHAVHVYVFYGWTCGAVKRESAELTEGLVQAIKDESQECEADAIFWLGI